MKEGDSWADRLGGTRGETESSRSVIETAEKREEDSCYCVDRTLLSAHTSPRSCSLRPWADRCRQRRTFKNKQINNKHRRSSVMADWIAWIIRKILTYQSFILLPRSSICSFKGLLVYILMTFNEQGTLNRHPDRAWKSGGKKHHGKKKENSNGCRGVSTNWRS